MKIAVLAALLLVGAACDSEDPRPREAVPAQVVLDEDRPCEAATQAEVAAAVGGDAGAARPVEARGKDRTLLCSYDVGPPFGTVILHVETDVSEDEFTDRMARDPLNSERLDGVGELAFTHGGVGVSVWEGGNAISASVQKFDNPDEMRAAVAELADLIDSKI